MDIEIAKPLSNLDVFLHRSTEHADFPIELLRDIKDDLQTMNRRSKRCDDNSALGFSEDLFERRNNGTLRWRATGHGRVSRIGKQREDAFLSVPAKGPEVDRLADHRRL